MYRKISEEMKKLQPPSKINRSAVSDALLSLYTVKIDKTLLDDINIKV